MWRLAVLAPVLLACGCQPDLRVAAGPSDHAPRVGTRPLALQKLASATMPRSDEQLGTPLRATTVISSDCLFDPAIAYNPRTTEYLIACVGRQGQYWGSATVGLYVQRVTTSGVPIGSPVPVSVVLDQPDSPVSDALPTPRHPAVAYDATDNVFLVVWEDIRNGSVHIDPSTGYEVFDNIDIYGQIVGASGQLIGGNFPVSNALSTQQEPSVASDGAGAFVVVWSDWRCGRLGVYDDVFGQRVDGTGHLLGSELKQANNRNCQWSPTVAFNAVAQEFLIAWSDNRSGSWNVYGQRLSRDGMFIGASFPVLPDSGRRLMPQIAASPTGDYVVTWADNTWYPANMLIDYVRLSSTGATIGSLMRVSYSADCCAGYPRIASGLVGGSPDGFIVVWLDRRDTRLVYAQRLSRSGGAIGANFAVAPPEMDGFGREPVVGSAGDGGYLVVASDDTRGLIARHLTGFGQ